MELEELRELLADILACLRSTETTDKSLLEISRSILETNKSILEKEKAILETEKAILAALSNPPATAIGNLFGAPKQ